MVELVIKNKTQKVEAVEIKKDGLFYRFTGINARGLIPLIKENGPALDLFLTILHK